MGSDAASTQTPEHARLSRDTLEGLVRHATDEAKRLHHPTVTPVHLLLGLFTFRQGDALKILGELGVNLEILRQDLKKELGVGDLPDNTPVTFEPEAIQVLDGAGQEAALLGHPYLATEHILLSLIRDEQGISARVLTRHHIEYDAVQRYAANLGIKHGVPVPENLPRRPPSRFTERAMYVLRSAQEQACLKRNDQVGTEHILSVMISGADDIGTLILESLGVEPSQVEAQLELYVGPGQSMRSITDMNFSLNAKQAIELAADEAHRLGHPQVGTEHLLLGIIREEQSPAARALHNLNVRLDFAREKVRTFPRHTQPRGFR